MKVLAIDTSNQVMSVAIMDNQRLIAEITTNVKRNHSVRLMPAIHQAMEEAKMKPAELDQIVVAHGPGSFTGVRIGVTTAKTMAYSLHIPIIAVSSLEMAAFNGLYFDGKICSFFDARRGRVYAGLYKRENKALTSVKDEENVLFTEWLEDLKNQDEKVLFISNDLETHKEKIKEILGEQAEFPPAFLAVPRASALAQIAQTKSETEIHTLTPNYLRLAEAEAKWLEKNQEQRKNG
ncbi:tRNA threonylcarbamoyladenosine biosynthesis protein TsaB [Salinibacillus kushneri]|uniref:tRNA threonylcarbamoyladenosine biosynthesis protein TsaB n=1 Tax=Salinibacillus kushneri TaxID=237682 RepID=A0A1I0J511_9BACI|nr:tRNA (adenosine(37)-N6)-threonylcarbamoyltransferase complex dimerization subunit type 1 TsaB [Salinibacillus kushneri]SEU04809.1 tRNA threonylcarbamoyladenosine biosynthesis protein TsaB [Salinibacillus kushneri]